VEKAQILIDAVPWSDDAARMLTRAAGGYPVEIYREQIEAGAVLFRASIDGDALAYWLLRVDDLPEGKEGVIVAAGGRAGFDLTAALLPVIEKQFSGVVALRTHATRAGAAKKFLKHPGWKISEVILRKAL
jgi:hypothetical protein